ncbi:MAG: hypothetical protein Q4E06_09665 [Lautropia sp.]|nr:hypothetical protein [Lautropia sp.]
MQGPLLKASDYAAGKLRVLGLNAPYPFNFSLTDTGPAAVLDGKLTLSRMGGCGYFGNCLDLSGARLAEHGQRGAVSWGRYTGQARLRLLLVDLQRELGSRHAGLHYLVGEPTPAVSMPTRGIARYALSGATSPTFASGKQLPGSFSGQGLVQFGAGTGTRVAIEGELKFGNSQHYRMVTEGAQFDARGQLSGVGSTNLRMQSPTTFSGELRVHSLGNEDSMKCGAGDCRAAISGGFFGERAAQMGLGYTITSPKQAGETDTIHGAAVLDRVSP